MATGSRFHVDLPKELPYDFLKKITNDFDEHLKISGGLFGTLYKGTIPDDGRVIAVEKLLENAPVPPDKTFTGEVRNILALKHENLVELVGFCSETSMKLVLYDQRYIQAEITESLLCYEYLPMGSLQKNLFAKKESEGASIGNWSTRFKIIKGICQGLRFLHTLDIPIMHMDLRPENILLDSNMVPKIAEFMLSRVFGQEETRMCTKKSVGSYAYMAPEYLYRGEISAQSDIYSLGLMIIEITTGEKNWPENNQPCARNFIEKVQKKWTREHIASKVPEFSEGLEQIELCIQIGLECVNMDRKFRPPIAEIVQKLKGIS